MKLEKLLSLMPTVTVKEEERGKKIVEQHGLVEAGKSYVSHLSINRFLYTNLANLDIEQRLNLFSDLTEKDGVITENQLYFYDIDIESFAAILEEEFKLENMYELDNYYIENLLNGIDITEKEINCSGENTLFADILLRFTFRIGGMDMGDTPNLMLMLTVKKALLGSYLAEKNVEALLNGEREIYDISILL